MDVIDSIIDEVVKTMPTPSPIADEKINEGINNEQKTESNTPGNNQQTYNTGQSSNAPIFRDKKDSIFDPEIHSVDTDGNPKKNKNGTFAKKRGRKSGEQQTPINRERMGSIQAGKATSEAIFTLGMAIGGVEWSPIIDIERGINEPQQMQDAWASYYEATGNTDMPPWVVVAIVCGAYSLPRLRLPQTQSRLKRFTGWVKGLVFKDKK